MPRISAGGPSPAPDDSIITRVDISPEDIRKMSDEDLHSLLASIRNKRETNPPRAASRKGTSSSATVRDVDMGDMEEME